MDTAHYEMTIIVTGYISLGVRIADNRYRQDRGRL